MDWENIKRSKTGYRLLLVLIVVGSVATAMAVKTVEASKVKPKQGCFGAATTFVRGLGQKGPHNFYYVGSGTDWYFDPYPAQTSYTGGAGVTCSCGR